MKKIFSLICLVALPITTHALTSPTSLKLTIHQVAVALNEDCSSPIVIFTSGNAAGTESNLLISPALGSGNLANGTYNCIMITMEDAIKFTPTANDGASCLGGTEYTIDLCRNTASSSAHQSMTDILVGTTTTNTECSGTAQAIPGGGISNKVTLYLRTNALVNGHSDQNHVTSWRAGTAAIGASDGTNPTVARPNGIQLASPFVVSGTKTGIFYLDATNKVNGAGGSCEMDAPLFGFR